MAAGSIGASTTWAGCSAGSDPSAYEAAASSTWRATTPADGMLPMRELVRLATLAPSSHNTQCWKFALEGGAILIRPDLSRRCPVVDPDDHHLFVSLGCATENLVQAASANGLHADVSIETSPVDAVRVTLTPMRAVPSPLFEAITQRQCTRAEFDGNPLPSGALRRLAAAGASPGVNVLLLTDKAATERALEFVVAGNTAQMSDPAFVKELKTWIRFDRAEAVRQLDGLSTLATGNPSLPRWLASPMFDVFVSAKSENDKYAKQVRSSSGIAVFVADGEGKAHWVETGRCYERFALQATALGIRTAFLNQAVEVATLRLPFADSLGIGGQRPDLVVRFGRGPEMPRSLRRGVEAVLA